METSNPLSVHEIQYQYEDTRDLIVGKINWPQKKRAVKEEGYENNEDRSDSEKRKVLCVKGLTQHRIIRALY